MSQPLMPRRAGWFGPIMSGIVCVLLATAAPGFVGSAQAECMVQPNQQAPQGAYWSLHFDRDKNRRCWILVDAAGRDLSPPQPAPPATLSPFQSFLNNLAGVPPALPPASVPAVAPRKPHLVQPHAANANRAERAVRTEQKADAQTAKHEMTPGERDALFEEFLRWHESQKITGAAPQ